MASISYSELLERNNSPRNKIKYVAKKETFPVHSAVEYQNLYKLEILLRRGKIENREHRNVNECNEKGKTVLHVICDQYLDNLAVLDFLLSYDDIDESLIEIIDNDGFNALHYLAYRGNLRGIVKLFQRFPNFDIDVETDKENTALIIATRMNYIDIIQYLLSKGADVNHTNHKKYTALHYAANGGYIEATKILLNSGADIDVAEGYGLTPLMKSCSWGFEETCEVLLRSGADVNSVSSGAAFTPLICSCRTDSVEITKMLILFGAVINYPEEYCGALYECVKRGSLRCAKELLKTGVVNISGTRKGYTAYQYAKNIGNTAIAELLEPYFCENK